MRITGMKTNIRIAAGILAAAAAYVFVPQTTMAQSKDQDVQPNSWLKYVDPDRAAKVPVVLRVHLLKREGGDKYGWDQVRLIGVIKNSSHHRFAGDFKIAHYSGEAGIPDGDCTVYLEQYNRETESLWKLSTGSGGGGVSHADTSQLGAKGK
jgi:hypothetical protein